MAIHQTKDCGRQAGNISKNSMHGDDGLHEPALPPALPLFSKQEAAKTAVRLKLSNRWKHRRPLHTSRLEDFVQEEPLLEAAVDKIPKQYIKDTQLFENPNERLNFRDIRVFNDGLKTNTVTEVFFNNLNIKILKLLGDYNSVF